MDPTHQALIVLGIVICLSQSAIFSGLNLALFSLGRLELEALSDDPRAKKLQRIRDDGNFALVTILWGNVGVNVLLALLSESILHGLGSFLFSTVAITIFAEILPQAYFSRHALKIAASLTPILRFYQLLLYPVAKPTALVLDRWLGGEKIRLFREQNLRQVIKLHMNAHDTEIAKVEGQGALNFLELDDISMNEEGEPLDPSSIVPLSFDGERPIFPKISNSVEDDFLRQIDRSGKSWVILTDPQGEPRLLLKAHDFLREALFTPESFMPQRHCHRPLVFRDGETRLGEILGRFRAGHRDQENDIVDNDVVLLWSDQPRVVTGTDLLGRLLRGIARSK